MKINIVNSEPIDSILGKFARRLSEWLLRLGHECKITVLPEDGWDLYHYIYFITFQDLPGQFKKSNSSVMITHLDQSWKVNLVKEQSRIFAKGICLSKFGMERFISMGIPADKLDYAHPGQDEIVKPRKLRIGLITDLYVDGRKRENILLEIVKHIKPEYFEFVIMGKRWENILNQLGKTEFYIEYYDHYDPAVYQRIIPTLDYFLYFGLEEGSMAFLDAVRANVKTIVPPDGTAFDYVREGGMVDHLNLDPIHFVNTFVKIQEEIENRTRLIKEWTWKAYTEKCIQIWKGILDEQGGRQG